ncbi:MAG: DUF5343 domain-containing protein [Pyrinomonadaceae bacterium]
MATLPYVTSPGNIDRALRGIKSASTPERVTQDFVKTILQIPGGSGNQIASFLKKIGFANQDGTPSDIYKKFRNSATAGKAAADALKIGYADLYTRNEFIHQLSDEELKGLIIEETGQSEDSSVPGLILSSIKALKKFADFGAAEVEEVSDEIPVSQLPVPIGAPSVEDGRMLGLNLAYTINLNLPATADIAVFNAIFKSLKENLLKDTYAR